jgi:hypothetical protein
MRIRRSHNQILFQTTLLVGFFLIHNNAFDMNYHPKSVLPTRQSSLHHRREINSDRYGAKQQTRLMSTYASTSTRNLPSSQHSLDASSKGSNSLQHHMSHVQQSTGSCDVDGYTDASTKTQSVSLSPSNVTENVANCSWIVVVAVFLFGQIFNKGNTSSMMGPPSTGSNNSMMYSAVSASLLRHQQPRRGAFSLNLQTLLAWGIVLWQLSSKAGPIGKLLLSYAIMFSGWYMNVLDASPLVTKAVTTAVIGLLGDTGAQYIEERIRAKKEGSKRSWFQSYDRRRGLSIVGGSILVTGPMLHIAYNILEDLIPVVGGGAAASMAALTQVLINDFFLDAIFVATTFVTTGVAEGYSHQIIPQLRKDYFATIKASWATSLGLMPLEFVCFRFLPLSFRVLGMNFIDIFWEALISFMIHRRRRMDTDIASTSSSPVPSSS